jgi:hypothetical protein
MKRYSVLSVLWLAACGAGAGQGDDDKASLSAPLVTDDEDAVDSTEPVPAEVSAELPLPTSGGEAHDCDDPAASGTVSPSSGIMIGGGGEAWATPTGGAVVWCHVDVPIGCAAIEPTPNGGRLVVIEGPEAGTVTVDVGGPEAGGSEGPWSEIADGEAGSSEGPSGQIADGEAGSSAAAWGESADGEAGGASGSAGEIVFVDVMPVPGVPPSPQVPVVIGGSLPPLPGTCVVVTFGSAGEMGFPVAGVSTAGGAGQAPSAGVSTAGGAVQAPTAGGSSTDVADEPSSGTVTPTPPHAGALPALPPPGYCLGVSFPTVPAGIPSSGATAPVGGPVSGSEPTPPGAGACVAVAFAASADPKAPVSAIAAPVMCAAPLGPPVSAGTASSDPAIPTNETGRADDVR